jgi:hypothetical protein
MVWTQFDPDQWAMLQQIAQVDRLDVEEVISELVQERYVIIRDWYQSMGYGGDEDY